MKLLKLRTPVVTCCPRATRRRLLDFKITVTDDFNCFCDCLQATVGGFRISGTVTNDQAAVILNNAGAVEQLVSREMVIDSVGDVGYDKENTLGGVVYGTGLQPNDRTGGIGDPSQGVAGVQQGDGSATEGWGQPDRVAVNPGVLRVCDELTTAQQKRGTITYSE